jgi:hypothetical protein
MTEPISSQNLFDGNQYYTMDMIKAILPHLDEIGYYILYNRINEMFIDEEEKLQNEKIIERLKKSRELRMKPDLEKLMENEENKKITQ